MLIVGNLFHTFGYFVRLGMPVNTTGLMKLILLLLSELVVLDLLRAQIHPLVGLLTNGWHLWVEWLALMHIWMLHEHLNLGILCLVLSLLISFLP